MNQTLSYYSTVLYRDFSAYTAERLQELGLNFGSLFFVIYVGKHPNCTPTELTEALHMDWGHSQRSIAKLVESGFMTKEKSLKNSRSYQLNLTDLGKSAFAISHQVFFDWDKERISVLSEAEQTQLLTLLEKITNQERR